MQSIDPLFGRVRLEYSSQYVSLRATIPGCDATQYKEPETPTVGLHHFQMRNSPDTDDCYTVEHESSHCHLDDIHPHVIDCSFILFCFLHIAYLYIQPPRILLQGFITRFALFARSVFQLSSCSG